MRKGEPDASVFLLEAVFFHDDGFRPCVWVCLGQSPSQFEGFPALAGLTVTES